MLRETKNPLVGKVIRAIDLADDNKAIRFHVEGGDPIVARADGDCCSSTWIEALQGVEQVIGSEVVAVEDVSMERDDATNDDGEEIAFYGCKIVTHAGYLLIDFRNASNGYYGGDLAWPGEYFYGGVFGQNVSSEQWVPVPVE